MPLMVVSVPARITFSSTWAVESCPSVMPLLYLDVVSVNLSPTTNAVVPFAIVKSMPLLIGYGTPPVAAGFAPDSDPDTLNAVADVAVTVQTSDRVPAGTAPSVILPLPVPVYATAE